MTAFLVFAVTILIFCLAAVTIRDARWRRLHDRTRPGLPGDYRHRH